MGRLPGARISLLFLFGLSAATPAMAGRCLENADDGQRVTVSGTVSRIIEYADGDVYRIRECPMIDIFAKKRNPSCKMNSKISASGKFCSFLYCEDDTVQAPSVKCR